MNVIFNMSAGLDFNVSKPTYFNGKILTMYQKKENGSYFTINLIPGSTANDGKVMISENHFLF